MDLSAAERELLARVAGLRSFEAIRPRGDAGSAVASYGQQQLWLLDQLNPGSREYVIPAAIRLTGDLDPDALRVAFTRLVERHEILRSRFILDDSGVLLQLAHETSCVSLEYFEPREPDGRSLDALADQQLRDLAEKPFDMERGPLLHMRLTRLATEDYLLTMAVHHITCDGWSLGVIARELPVHYAAARLGRETDLQPLAIQYADFAVWQRSDAQADRFERQVAFWREYLAGLRPIELTPDLPRPPIRTGDGDALRLRLPRWLSSRVSDLAVEHRVTPYMVYLAVYQMLLSMRTGREDIAVGTPVSGRNRAETEDLIGYFVNTIVVRTDLSGDPSFVEYLLRVRAACLDAFSHQDVPFPRLVDELRAAPDLSRTPLVQHAFVYGVGFDASWDLPGVRGETLDSEMHIAKCDLSISLSDSGADGNVRVEYATDLFHESTAETIGCQFLDVLNSVLERPGARLSEHGSPSRGRTGRTPSTVEKGTP